MLAALVRRLVGRQPLARGAMLCALLAGLLPASVVAGTSLQQVDWASVIAADPQVAGNCRFAPMPSYVQPSVCVQLMADTIISAGAGSSRLQGYAASDRVLYGDLVGDGDEEAVVPISFYPTTWYPSGIGSLIGFLVYRAGAGAPQLVASAAGRDLSLQIAGGALQVSRPRTDPPCDIHSFNSCPSTVVITSYNLENGALVASRESEQPLAQHLGLPPEVLALLPQGSGLRAGLDGGVTGDGTASWVLLYEAPTSSPEWQGTPFVDGHLAIMSPGPKGWVVAEDLNLPNAFSHFRGFLIAMPQAIELHDVAGTPAIVLSGLVSGHGTALLVVRWDGAEFQEVFWGLTPRVPPALDLEDLDGNGVPEVVDREPSMCVYLWGPPDWLTVYRWDSATFSDATAQYPTLLSQAEADAQAMLAKVEAGQAPDGIPTAYLVSDAPRETACLHALLAVLAARSGDMATAAIECDQAQAAAPDRDMLMAAIRNLPGAGDLCMPDGGGSQ